VSSAAERAAADQARLVARLRLEIDPLELDVPGLGVVRGFATRGTGTPLVLLHGATLSAAWWLPLLPHLTGRTVVALDAPGHGLSDGLSDEDFSLRAVLVALTTAAVRATGSERAVLVGNSLGGMAAAWTALDAPALVERLVLVGAPGVAFAGGRADALLGALAVPATARALLTGPTLPAWYASGLRRSLAEPALADWPELGELAYHASRRPGFRHTVPRMLQQLLAFRTPRPDMALTAPELHALPPTTYLHGRDEAFLPYAAARVALAVIPEAEGRQVDGGHVPWLTGPAPVVAAL
jgi:pimeloyl-ACP methyl ester carboxylesterase